MEQPKNILPSNFSDLLPLGYLYLLIIGIVSDSIYYGLLGINIISYSTILDVLLSPVNQITDNYKVLLFIIILPAFAYFYVGLMRKWAEKKAAQSGKTVSVLAISPIQVWISFTAFVIFSAYIGIGLGKGVKTKERMENGELSPRHRLTLQDGKSLEVRIVGNNSSYIFYVAKNAKSVTVIPIQDNITKIEVIENKEGSKK